MNCVEFENLVNELASDRLVDAVTRKRALVHAAVCEACARQLTAQRMLNTGLLEFAEATGREHPPLRVKQAVRAAWLEGQPVPLTAPVAGQTTAKVLTFRPAKQTNWTRWALAAAATILMLFTISILLWRRPAANEQLVAERVQPTPQVTQVLSTPLAPQAAQTVVAPPFANEAKARRRVARTVRVVAPAAEEEELVSEFVPLTLAADERALANGTLVRLEVPRARLIAMGLPLRVEADRETVKADVMLGDNGVAYAIRVVR